MKKQEVASTKFTQANKMNECFLDGVNKLQNDEKKMFFEMEELLFEESIRATMLELEQKEAEEKAA
jgi:hypothetical protein